MRIDRQLYNNTTFLTLGNERKIFIRYLNLGCEEY